MTTKITEKRKNVKKRNKIFYKILLRFKDSQRYSRTLANGLQTIKCIKVVNMCKKQKQKKRKKEKATQYIEMVTYSQHTRVVIKTSNEMKIRNFHKI